MADSAYTAATVQVMLATRWPGRFNGDQVQEHVSLGEGGLGLDSIEIVELLLDCEERIGGVTVVEELLESGPITVGQLIAHLATP